MNGAGFFCLALAAAFAAAAGFLLGRVYEQHKSSDEEGIL